MKFEYTTLETCENSRAMVVVIDVLRAFSTAAYAFSSGVQSISLVSNVDDAFGLKDQFPQALLLGEVEGLPVDGFDYGNSPSSIMNIDLHGRQMIQRTSAGTQGVVKSKNASQLLASSLCCASATAKYIQAASQKVVTFVITGYRSDDRGAEDLACAEYIESIINGQKLDTNLVSKRVRESAAAQKFLDPNKVDFPLSDLDYCTRIDKFNFAMLVERQQDQLLMRPVPQG